MDPTTRSTGIVPAMLTGLCLLASVRASLAQAFNTRPEALEEVGVVEHLDVQLPLDAKFIDERGNDVTLGDFFSKDRPVLLTLNYYGCPQLCTWQLNGLVEGLSRMEMKPGREFEIVTVSIAPRESVALAQQKKRNYITQLGDPEAANGWHFLLSPEEDNVKRLAATVGFNYRYDPETLQYAHAAASFVCTPDGRVSRYLYGIEYLPQTLRLSLVEAGQGRIGSTMDRVLLFCFHYDPARGRYSLAAMTLMRAGGLVTVFALGAVAFAWHRRGSRRSGQASEEGPQTS